MQEKRVPTFKSPDLNELKAVIIDSKTTIFIDKDQDPEEAKNRYLARNISKYLKVY